MSTSKIKPTFEDSLNWAKSIASNNKTESNTFIKGIIIFLVIVLVITLVWVIFRSSSSKKSTSNSTTTNSTTTNSTTTNSTTPPKKESTTNTTINEMNKEKNKQTIIPKVKFIDKDTGDVISPQLIERGEYEDTGIEINTE